MEHLEGRAVLDTLRHVLTACNLASFSLVDCCQALLGRRMEVLPPSAAARLSGCTARPAQGTAEGGAAGPPWRALWARLPQGVTLAGQRNTRVLHDTLRALSTSCQTGVPRC